MAKAKKETKVLKKDIKTVDINIPQEKIIEPQEENVMNLDDTGTETKVNGLGDVVKAVTNAIGIETCDDCEQRRLKLNKMFPFTKKAKRELNDTEITFIESIGTKLNQEDRFMLGSLYEALYGGKVRHCTSCPGVYKSMISKLKMQIEYQRIV